MSANYMALLKDPNPRKRIILWEVGYRFEAANYTARMSDKGYASQPDDSVEAAFPGIVLTRLNSNQSLISDGVYGGVASSETLVLEWQNKRGAFDSWLTGISIDGRPVRALMVGETEQGVVVGYDEAAETPFFLGEGMGRPEVDTRKVSIKVKSLAGLDRQMATRRFDPFCLRFPGTTAGCVDFGDVLDRTGSFTWEAGWIKTEDPSLSGQTIVEKDTGTAGWRLELGTAGDGALRFIVREQSPTTSDTAAGLIRLGRWHHVAIGVDTAAGTRYVFLDGTLVLTTSGVTGSPAGNSATLKIGKGFLGCISWSRVWSPVLTAANIRENLFLPVASSATGLEDLLLLDEGYGTTTAGKKAGSTISGTLGTGVTWARSGWCGSSLAGRYWPVVIGMKLDLKLTPNDPAENHFGVSWPCLHVDAVRSSHLALTPTIQYTVDRSRGPGIIHLTASANGTLSADVVGETTFGSAVLFDGSSGYAHRTLTSPAGTMAIHALFRAETHSFALTRVAGWTAGSGAGQRILAFSANRRVRFVARNDAGTAFIAEFSAAVSQGRWHSVLGELDTTFGEVRLYVDGELVATTAVSGTFNTTASAFTVGRNSTTASEYFPGKIDEVSIWTIAPGLTTAERLAVFPAEPGTPGLQHYWPMQEASGGTIEDLEGSDDLTLAGTYSWSYSRIALCDNVVTALLNYSSYTRADLDASLLARLLREAPGDSGWYAEDEQTVRAFLHFLLRGSGAYLRESLTSGLLEVSQLAVPSGTADPDSRFNRRDIYVEEIAPASETLGEAYYGIALGYAHNANVMNADQLAGLVASDPERFQFAQQAWREAVFTDPSILLDFPYAKILRGSSGQSDSTPIPTGLLNEADALLEAERIFELHRPTRPPISIPLRTSANQVQLGGEIEVEYKTADGSVRLGMAPANFRVLAVRRSQGGRRVTATCIP